MNQYTNNTITREQREQHFIERLFEKDITLKYIGGYIHSDKPVMLECNVCGCRFKINATCVREGHNLECPKCRTYKEDRIRKINNLLKEQQKSIDRIIKQNELEVNKIRKKLLHNTIYIKKCRKCNNEIITKYSYQTLCSKCARIEYKKNHSYKSLKELYKRDKGICYICNKKCDYEDYTYRGNTFIAGNYYPSIDHVIPLIKGGSDDWDNLRLAHRICNSIKSIADRG